MLPAMKTSAIPPEPRRPFARRATWSSTPPAAAAQATAAARAGARDRAARRARRDVLGAIARELRRRPSAA